MMSCILLFYLAVLSGPAQAPAADADALYAQREDLARAKQGDGGLGTRRARGGRKALLEHGVEAGRTAAALEPRRPEGHFWMAANMGALAESFGLRQGLKYRGAIRDALQTVLKLDAAYQHGSADRAL